MIKASGQNGDTPVLLIGLSKENCARLLAGRPIMFNASEVGLADLQLIIVGGETEDHIAADIIRQTGGPAKFEPK